MKYDEIKTLGRDLKKDPIRTTIYVIVSIVIFTLVCYAGAYFAKAGEKAATIKTESSSVSLKFKNKRVTKFDHGYGIDLEFEPSENTPLALIKIDIEIDKSSDAEIVGISHYVSQIRIKKEVSEDKRQLHLEFTLKYPGTNPRCSIHVNKIPTKLNISGNYNIEPFTINVLSVTKN